MLDAVDVDIDDIDGGKGVWLSGGDVVGSWRLRNAQLPLAAEGLLPQQSRQPCKTTTVQDNTVKNAEFGRAEKISANGIIIRPVLINQYSPSMTHPIFFTKRISNMEFVLR